MSDESGENYRPVVGQFKQWRLKEWRQQRLLYRHQRLYPGDWSAPPQFSVDPRLILWESLRTVLDKTPVSPDVTVYDQLRTRVVDVMVDRNPSGPGIYVYVTHPKRGEPARDS